MIDKIKKIIVVLFLTLLIWAYAYLALEDTVDRRGTLDISPSISPELLVTFDRETPIVLNLTLKGAAAKVQELKNRYVLDESDPEKERLDFYYSISPDDPSIPGTITLDILKFLEANEKLKELNLTPVECGEVKTVKVNVEKLVRQELTVQCFDENDRPIDTKSIEPGKVSMYVRQNFSGPARVTISEAQAVRARTEPITVTPYVMIGTRNVKCSTNVKVALPSMEELLKDKAFQPKRVGFVFSNELQGKYTAVLSDDNILKTTYFKTTDEAFAAYENMRYHVLIEVHDVDVSAGPETDIERPVIYNFPPAYLQKREIRVVEDSVAGPKTAKFKLIPVTKE